MENAHLNEHINRVLDFENGKAELSRTYCGELFSAASWYTSRLNAKDSRISMPLSSKSEISKEEIVKEKETLKESAPILKSEKEKTLDSLKEFASKEIEKERELPIRGGSIAFKTSTEGVASIDLDFSPYERLSDYLEFLKICNNCSSKKYQNYFPANDIRLEIHDSIDIMFVGGVPLEENYVEGVGNSFSRETRDLVKKMAIAMNLDESKYCNSLVIKCIFDDDSKEIGSKECLKNLMQEIYLLRPKIVVTFGALATNLLLGKKEKLSKIHGKFFTKRVNFGSEVSFNFDFMPIFHPEFLLINPKMKRAAWEDLQKVIERITRV